ncbi:hypothetical protein, partial [Oleiphilus sp. HI0080]|uniref:hypothetical protein n=1 Tax=Oleiphilus sp. HI0080 TaxID=1822255 RepID=UPI0018D4CCCE
MIMPSIQDNYREALKWATQRGLELHPHIERKIIDGVPGLFAKSKVNAGCTFASIPKAALLNPRPNHYPAGTSTAAIHIHSASREMDLGESSEFAPVFKLFDP